MKFSLLVAVSLIGLGQCSLQEGDYITPNHPLRSKRHNPPKPVNHLWSSTWTDKLKQDLLVTYDKFARPAEHTNKTFVYITPNFRYIDLDERKSIMTVNSYMAMNWEDEKLKWDPDKYNGLDVVNVAAHEVWQPDIVPLNSASGSTIDHYGNTNILVHSDGKVIWVPPSTFHFFCNFDFTYWPFDKQTCSLILASLSYHGLLIDLDSTPEMDPFNVKEVHLNSEWDLVNVTAKRSTMFYECCREPFFDVTYTFTVQRRSEIYKVLLFTPASVLVLMTLAMFWLPATSGDKITLGVAAFIISCVFTLYFCQKIPTISTSTPNIVSFYSRCILFIVFALIIAVAVINIAGNPKSTPLPWILKRNLRGPLGKCLLIGYSNERGSPKVEEITGGQQVLSDHERQQLEEFCQRDWILLGMAIDRIFFLVYCVAFCLLAMIYSV